MEFTESSESGESLGALEEVPISKQHENGHKNLEGDHDSSEEVDQSMVILVLPCKSKPFKRVTGSRDKYLFSNILILIFFFEVPLAIAALRWKCKEGMNNFWGTHPLGAQTSPAGRLLHAGLPEMCDPER